jgi:hypothetical protein
MATCACREPKSGRIGDAVRQPGRATRYVRAAEPGKKPAHPGPMIDAFSQYCNSERTLAESGADAGNASVICRAIASATRTMTRTDSRLKPMVGTTNRSRYLIRDRDGIYGVAVTRASPSTMMWSTHSRRIVWLRSAAGGCAGMCPSADQTGRRQCWPCTWPRSTERPQSQA